MARTRKKFSPYRSAAEKSGRRGRVQRSKGRRGRRRTRKEDSEEKIEVGGGKEGLKLLADISSGEQAR